MAVIPFPAPSRGGLRYLRRLVDARREIDAMIHDELRRLRETPSCPVELADVLMSEFRGNHECD